MFSKIKYIPREKLIIRKSFALPYHNAMIWAEDLDALSVHSDLVREKFLADMAEIRKPSSPALIAMNVYGTLVEEPLARIFASALVGAGASVKRVAFIGLGRQARGLLRGCLEELQATFAYTFLDDFEKAKEWLV